MDEPARRIVMAGKTRPEQPEAPPVLVLDPVIIADRIAGGRSPGSPPFFGHPLRPVGARNPMRKATPGKAERRVVGQQPEGFDRFRRREQPDRPRRFIEMTVPFLIRPKKMM
jgi:hypothetical protein